MACAFAPLFDPCRPLQFFLQEPLRGGAVVIPAELFGLSLTPKVRIVVSAIIQFDHISGRKELGHSPLVGQAVKQEADAWAAQRRLSLIHGST